MDPLRTTLVEGAGLTVPANFRNAIGIKPGDMVVVKLRGDELRIRPDEVRIRPDLEAERRAEAARGD